VQIRASPTAACPEMAAPAKVVRSFAALLAPSKDNPARLAAWTTAAREADLPHLHSFVRGIEQDIDAVTVAITLEYHNGRTEGVNTKRSYSSGRCTEEPASTSYLLTELSSEITPGQRRFLGSGSYSAHGSGEGAIAGLGGHGRAPGGPSR
jgi:hypothetical protein